MCCTSENYLNHRQTKKRLMISVLLICFIMISLLSEVIIHRNHEHDHNGIGGICATCIQIQNADNILKQIGIAVMGTLLILAGIFTAAYIRSNSSKITLLTPITLKIRMNN